MKHIVVDLEMNPIRKKDPARRIVRNEVIEIGAVMMDDSLTEVAAFKTFVKPLYNDKINGNITNITGITTEMVKDAPDFTQALHLFASWCTSFDDDVTVYSWSDNDYHQISKEMELKQYVPLEGEKCIYLTEWTDFQNEFVTVLNFQKAIALSTALDISGVELTGRAHDALDDARNTASLLKVLRDPELFEEKLCEVRDVMEEDHLSSSIGSLFDLEGLLAG